MYKFLLRIVSVLIKIIYRVRVNGIENFKDDEPIIISANHIHIFDPVILATLTKKQIFFLAKKELFSKKFLSISQKFRHPEALFSRILGFLNRSNWNTKIRRHSILLVDFVRQYFQNFAVFQYWWFVNFGNLPVKSWQARERKFLAYF